MKPWCSIGTLAGLCAALAMKLHQVRLIIPEIAWWEWPIVLLGGVAMNFGFFFWLGRLGHEGRAARGARPVMALAGVVFLALVFL